MPFEVNAIGAPSLDNNTTVQPLVILRRDVRDNDVLIDIAFCGICHSDIHHTRGEWSAHLPDDVRRSQYPAVPGHEIVGKVTQIGQNVTNVQVGDIVGVGCLVGSCLKCDGCQRHEQLCASGQGTYGSADNVLVGQPTHGGYSNSIVVQDHFAVKIPEHFHANLAAVAPLLCAGITTYSPLRAAKVTKGTKVGVVGLGGLGHMAVKQAVAMGAEVYVFSRTAAKQADAERLGVKKLILTTEPENMAAAADTLDVIVDTVSDIHDINALLSTIRPYGALYLVGGNPKPYELSAFALILGNKSVHGSAIGSIAETAEMLAFCAQNNIIADIEMVDAQHINEAWARVSRSDVKYRFVIDIEKSLPKRE